MKVLLPVSLIVLTSEVHDVTVARASLKIRIAMSIVAGLTVAALATPLSRFVTNTEANARTFMMLGATVVAAGVGPVLVWRLQRSYAKPYALHGNSTTSKQPYRSSIESWHH